MNNILEISNLRKDYKGFSLNNISFNLERGYIMGFIGPNGAGKSTTIRLIMNLLRKDEGDIKVFGLDHIKHERDIKNRIGFVYDENYFYDELTVNEMKGIIAPFYKKWDESAFEKYLKEFELPKNKKIKELSKGMKMKFSMALALSHQAELLIMDEPTSGLDPVVRSELMDILRYIIQDESKGIFFSTHITADLDRIADYITFINHGEIVFSSLKDEVMDNYAIVKGEKEFLNKDTRKFFVGIRENQFGFEALTENRNTVRKTFGDRIVIEKPSLDDIMVYCTRRERNA